MGGKLRQKSNKMEKLKGMKIDLWSTSEAKG